MVLLKMLAVLAGAIDAAATTSCTCVAVPGHSLHLNATCNSVSAHFSYANNRVRLTLPRTNKTECLGYDSFLNVVALPCSAADEGQVWSLSPFGAKTLANRAAMRCLTATNGGLVLLTCAAEPGQKQMWDVTEDGRLKSAAGRCATPSPPSLLAGGPCWLNATLSFDGAETPPAYSALGATEASFGGDLTISVQLRTATSGRSQDWARLVDLGNPSGQMAGQSGDNIILGRYSNSDKMVYQVYGTEQLPVPPYVVSKDAIPNAQWLHVVVVQRGGVASMYWRNASSSSGSTFELQASGAVNVPANVKRSSNRVGLSNWAADARLKGMVRDLRIYNRALDAPEIVALGSAAEEVAPSSGGMDLCAAGPPPLPPAPAAFALDLAKTAGGVVAPKLYGHDLEFTRHDLFTGLSAEIIANRKFAVPTPCAPPTGIKCWPKEVQDEMVPTNVAPRWRKIGAPKLDLPYWKANSELVTGDVGHSVRCAGAGACGVIQESYLDGFDSGMSFGSAIVVESGKVYSLRLVLRGGSSAHVTASLGGWTKTFTATAEWSTVVANFTAAATSRNATLTIASGPAGGDWSLGSVSLTPVANTWRGMRMDVVNSLKETGFKGLFRYPGGCYAPFYRWKIGLLDTDMRPPIETPPGYCDAVAGGVNAYTDGMMENGISTDDYLALCEYVGLIPSLTVRFQMGQDADVQEARDWVEYVNGPVTSPYGKIRAARGHPEPYNVTYFYLGNEIAQQQRYPTYPQNTTQVPPPSVEEYKQMVTNIVAPMLKASPATPIRLLTVSGSVVWNKAWADAVGSKIYAASFHKGYFNQPTMFTQASVTTCAMRPRPGSPSSFMDLVAGLRKTLSADPNSKHIAISADEWGLGPPWESNAHGPNEIRFSVTHGMYAASFLGSVTRGAQAQNLQMTNYFEPINEGAVVVSPFSSNLTPVGQVMKLFSAHTSGTLVALPAAAFSGDLDTVATLDANGRGLTITISHLNAVGWRTYNLDLTLENWHGSVTGATTTLKAQGWAADSLFDVVNGTVALSDDGVMKLVVPPFSVVKITLDGAPFF